MKKEKKFLKPEGEIFEFPDIDTLVTSNVLDELGEDDPKEH